MPTVTRRTFVFLVSLGVLVFAAAAVAAYVQGVPLHDPDKVLGPYYVRLPAIFVLFFVADIAPRAIRRSRGVKGSWPFARELVAERWSSGRIKLAAVGMTAFYATYFGYRNIKNLLPFVREEAYTDGLLAQLDYALMFGNSPAELLHALLGTGMVAHLLSFVYTAFLGFVPVSMGAALVWSRNLSLGFWYVSALCVNWTLGALSYYWLPSVGPWFSDPTDFSRLPVTLTTELQDSLAKERSQALLNPQVAEFPSSVAAFASLHVSIVFTAALIAHYAMPQAWLRRAAWAFFGLTVVATIYFGWHYILDDVAGLAIGYISVYLGAKVTRHGMSVQRPERPARHEQTSGGRAGAPGRGRSGPRAALASPE